YMSGAVDVQSTVGKGTSFTFTLPVADEAVLEQKVSLVKDQHAVVQENLLTNQDMLLEIEDIKDDKKNTLQTVDEDKPSIIVVDDDPINLRVMEVVLHHEQYDVTTVLSGAEAIELLEQAEYDLIISDVMMPHMSGFELVKKVRS